MFDSKQIFTLYKAALIKNPRNIRVILLLIIQMVLCLVLLLPVLEVAKAKGMKINVFEPLIAINSTPLLFLLFLACSLLMFSDLAFLDNNECMIIYRAGRFNWVVSKLLYIVTVNILNILMIAGIFFIATLPIAYYENHFSEFYIALAQGRIISSQYLFIPVSIMNQTSPYTAIYNIFLLTFLYMTFQALVLFILNLNFNRKVSIFLTISIGLIGFIISALPNNFIKYWIFNHTILEYHSLFYYDMFSVAQSVVIFIILMLFISVALFWRIDKHSFRVFE